MEQDTVNTSEVDIVFDSNMVLYSLPTCPFCARLKERLSQMGYGYIEVSDVKQITEMGFETVPQLVVGDKVMDYSAATEWLYSQIKVETEDEA